MFCRFPEASHLANKHQNILTSIIKNVSSSWAHPNFMVQYMEPLYKIDNKEIHYKKQ